MINGDEVQASGLLLGRDQAPDQPALQDSTFGL